MTNDWYVEIRGDYPEPVDIHTQEQLDSLDRFYDALSEYLGGEDFEPAISSRAEAYETWVYIDAANSDEAAASATRMFREASELVWGPGTRVSALRAITSEERDLELAAELG
jgi:hypothetical protein